MKRIIVVISIVFSCFLNGAEDIVLDEYNKAGKYYESGNYTKSFELLSKLYLTRLSDSKFNFRLGHSAYEIGHYELALAAFQRVEILDPNNIRNKLEMARTYFMLKMYEDSEAIFEEVLENQNIPKNVRRNVELYLSKSKKVQKKSFTYARVDANWLYDSNVNYGSKDYEYTITSGTLPLTQESSDSAFQINVDVTNIYDIGDKNGFAIKNKVIGYLKKYSTYDKFNINYLAYMPSLLYSQTKYQVELIAGIDSLAIGNQNYLTTLSLMPRYEYVHTATLRSFIHFKFQKKDFKRTVEADLNANHFELSYSLQKILSPNSYIQGSIKGVAERKRKGDRVDVDYDEYNAHLIYAKQYTSIFGAELMGSYRVRDYNDFAPIFNSTRGDEALGLGFTLNAKVLETLSLNIKGGYRKVDSNQAIYSYEKSTLMLGINKIF